MKIIVKESDRYKSDLHEGRYLSEFLAYVMLDDNTSLGCEQVLGDKELKLVIQSYLSRMYRMGDIDIEGDIVYEDLVEKYVTFVSYEDFKNAVTENTPTYNG